MGAWVLPRCTGTRARANALAAVRVPKRRGAWRTNGGARLPDPPPRTAAALARVAQPARVAPPAWTATGLAPSMWGPSAQIAFSPLGTPEDSTRRSAPEYRAPERSSVVGAGHGCQPSAEAPPDISHHSKGDPQDQRRAERQVGRGPERGRCHRAAELMNEQGNCRPQNSSDQYVAGIVHPKVHPA